ncbi:MAG: 50S ribosomal protein L4 [Flavobacteriaceae bacterium]|jgi:large subunit ribosomal protein L4|nr:50S ribosomal protein L4 [Flavobacteriaceae bacterium]
MELAVLDKSGKETGRKVSLDDQIFGIEPHQHAVYLEVKQYLAAQRQGTHKSKERSELSGSTRKLHRQKGTGGSRKGDIKNPLFRGGARVFGPRPRDYRFKLNKNLKRLAKKSAFSQKAKESNLKVLEDLSFDVPKTKDFIQVVKNLGLADKKALFVLGSANKFVYLSSRNLQEVKVLEYNEISSYDILKASEVILFEGSVDKIQENLRK